MTETNEPKDIDPKVLEVVDRSVLVVRIVRAINEVVSGLKDAAERPDLGWAGRLVAKERLSAAEDMANRILEELSQ